MQGTIIMHMQLLLDTIIASKFDFFLFGIGLIGYIFLFTNRVNPVKENRKTNDITFEVIDNTCQAAQTATEHLEKVLESTESCMEVGFVSAEIDSFLENFPQHPFGSREVQIILHFCRSLTDKTLADRLLEHMQPSEEWHILNEFIRFYMDTQQLEEACNLFELNYATFFDIELDQDMEMRLLTTALQCGRQSLADHLFQTSQSNLRPCVVTMQKWWRGRAAKMAESRVEHMGDVLGRLSSMFNERYPFEEHSDGESTCFLGDDSDWESDGDSDSNCGEGDDRYA